MLSHRKKCVYTFQETAVKIFIPVSGVGGSTYLTALPTFGSVSLFNFSHPMFLDSSLMTNDKNFSCVY